MTAYLLTVFLNTFLLTERIKSAAVKAGGGGVFVVPAAGGAAECPPWGDGSWDVDATSPTATQVEQLLDACSNL